jgi:hypothetical protein
VNVWGDGPDGSTTLDTTLPGAPTSAVATQDGHSATITWAAADGLADSFIVSVDGVAKPAVSSADPASVLFDNLVAGDHSATITPSNEWGSGTPTSFTFTMAASKPAQVTGVTVGGGSGSATVSWTALGASNNVLHYLVDGPGGMQTVGAGAHSATFTVVADHEYDFTVQAENDWGLGAITTVHLSTALPAAATTPVVAGAPHQATITWAAVSGANSYGVTLTGPSTQSTSGTGTSAQFAVTDNASYTVSVTPHGTWGDGASATLTFSTALPAIPRSVSVVGGRGTATVSWAPGLGVPASNGYVVVALAGGPQLTVAAGTTSATLKGLVNGRGYTFAVRALNQWGSSGLTGKGFAGSAITAKASASTILFGQKVTLSGVLTTGGKALKNTQVVIYARKAGTAKYVVVARVLTNTKGAYTWTAKPAVNTQYWIHYVGGPRMGVVSAVKAVTVRTIVTSKLSRTTVARGGAVTISGSVTPKHARQNVLVQRLVGKVWKTVATVKLSSTSSYAYKLPTSARGTFTYRVVKTADVDHGAGFSRPLNLKVS